MFWSDFFANFFSDLLAGVIIATGIAVWLRRRERGEESRKVELAKVNKTGLFLQFIRDEVVDLMETIPQRRNQFAETGYGLYFRFETYYWEALEPSGELPQLIEPNLLLKLVAFYAHLRFAISSMDKLVDTWLVPNPKSVPGLDLKMKAFMESTLSGIDKALAVGEGLSDAIDKEHETLKQRKKELKKGAGEATT